MRADRKGLEGTFLGNGTVLHLGSSCSSMTVYVFLNP